MTTFANKSVTCGACGAVFTSKTLTSTNRFGSPDLDTRPPEMAHSTLGIGLQRCPSCGYCADDVSKFDEKDRSIIDSPEYRAQLADTNCPELASSFICTGMIAENSSSDLNAGWEYLSAAWVFDDAHNDARARVWRSKAADKFTKMLASGNALMPQAGATEGIIVDCLRRAGRGSEALPIIERALAQELEPVIQKVFIYQKALIEKGDTACHLIKDAMEHK